MTLPQTRSVTDLSERELRAIVDRVRAVLWAGEDPDFEWSSDTIEEVAQVLINAGLRPARRNRGGR